MIVDIEKKALWVREQQEEHKRVQAAYAQIVASYEGAQTEKRGLQLRVRQAEAQSRQEDHLRRWSQCASACMHTSFLLPAPLMHLPHLAASTPCACETSMTAGRLVPAGAVTPAPGRVCFP